MADPTGARSAVVARALTLRGPHGQVYGPFDLEVDGHGVTVLVGPPGLTLEMVLLALAGRMRPRSGHLSVFDQKRASRMFAKAAVAGFDDVDAITGDVTVGEVLSEQMRWNSSWFKVIRRAGDADVARVCGPVFGELPLPGRHQFVEELSELDNLLLRIALTDIARPPLLVVGVLEQVSDDAERDLLVQRLIALGEHQTVVAGSVNGVPGHPVAHRHLDTKAGV
ncbi:hypothetical protein ACQI4F_10130 [Mycolicibacterium vaccae]|uniref:hypothetical protein n=1 Tax=Mycolicibacterium vaccae TaxID=1810 RepID=UPI003CF5CC6D